MPERRMKLAPGLQAHLQAAYEKDGDSLRVFLETAAGAVVMGVIPAQDVHEPGECCCKNCPWSGNHGTER